MGLALGHNATRNITTDSPLDGLLVHQSPHIFGFPE